MAYAVLTSAQGAILRNRIGDTDSTPKLSDTVLDAVYTEAGLDLDKATVGALQQLIGIYAMHTDVGGQTEINEQRSQRFEHLQSLLKYWTGVAGVGYGTLSTGALDLNIDTDYDDLEIE